jgi:hypothetical protein
MFCKGERIYEILSLFALLLIFSLAACRTTEETVRPTPHYDSWLDAQKKDAATNFSGAWDAGNVWEGGWGAANLVQEGRNVSGSIGLYNVKGLVSGSSVYMLLISNGYIYYTAKLDTRNNGSFSGIAAKESVVDAATASAEKYSLILKKLQKEIRTFQCRERPLYFHRPFLVVIKMTSNIA